MRLFLATLIVASHLVGSPAWAAGDDLILEPQSPADPQCEEKCLKSCQRHCKLGCVYECKCPEEKTANDQCRAKCVSPCHNVCQKQECLIATCEKQCQPAQPVSQNKTAAAVP